MNKPNINQGDLIAALSCELTKAHRRIELLEDKLSAQIDESNRLSMVVSVLQDALGEEP